MTIGSPIWTAEIIFLGFCLVFHINYIDCQHINISWISCDLILTIYSIHETIHDEIRPHMDEAECLYGGFLMSLRYWIIIVILGAGWGSSFVFNEILLREIGPLNMSLGRVGLGAIGCWVFAIAMRKSVRCSLGILMGLVFLGVINYAIPFALFPFSQQYVSGGVAGIINGHFSALLSRFRISNRA